MGKLSFPLADGLLTVAPNGNVALLNAAGRCLWEALEAGAAIDDLVQISARDGGVPPAKARVKILEALASWRELGLDPQNAECLKPHRRGRVSKPGASWSCASEAFAWQAAYLVGDRPVLVRCSNHELSVAIEASCGSHRVEVDERGLPRLDVVSHSDGLEIHAEGVFLTNLDTRTDDIGLARHLCLTALIEIARYPRQLLGIMHASAAGLNGHCVVFPGARGSSKSTLTAALVAAGAAFVSDDYSPLERASWRILPVPYAPGIKPGSWRVLAPSYPGLWARPVKEVGDLRVRYLDLNAAQTSALDEGVPIAALVFPSYRPGVGLEERPLSATEALVRLFRAQVKLDLRAEALEETLDWVQSVPAFELTYGDLDRAVDWIKRNFDG